jgi:hypothetical protein
MSLLILYDMKDKFFSKLQKIDTYRFYTEKGIDSELLLWLDHTLKSTRNNIKLLLADLSLETVEYQKKLENFFTSIISLFPSLGSKFLETYTLTFGDCAENHIRMQKIGTMATTGFNLEDLSVAQIWFLKKGIECDIYKLNDMLTDDVVSDDAYILIAINGLSLFGNPDDFYEEQRLLPKDSKIWSDKHGRVVNKNARHNLCFGPEAQSPKYEDKKGTIVAFDSVPLLASLRYHIPEVIGEKGRDLMVEGNYYYDSKCGIGFHSDIERKRVIGVRLGATMPLVFHWYLNSKPIGEYFKVNLKHGDVYIMSEKAVAPDGLKKKFPILRHAAGSDKYITIK